LSNYRGLPFLAAAPVDDKATGAPREFHRSSELVTALASRARDGRGNKRDAGR